MELEGKKIIITGGGSGIAAGCVRGYVREGAQVVFCDVNDEGGRATEEAANAQGASGKATYIHCDISKQENVKEFFVKALEILGGLDVLANIAGVKTAYVNTLNVYDILNCDKLVVVEAAAKKIEEVYA